jgi:hypothetical protein
MLQRFQMQTPPTRLPACELYKIRLEAGQFTSTSCACSLTFVIVDIIKQLDEEVGAAAGHMHKRALSPKPHARGNGKALDYNS